MPQRPPEDVRSRIRQRIALAYRERRLEAVQEALAPTVLLTMAGESPYSGPYRGIGATLAFIARSTRWVDPDSLAVDDRTGSDVAVSFLVSSPPAVAGSHLRLAAEIAVDDQGRITEIHVRADDQAAFDRLMGGLADESILSPPEPGGQES